MSAFTFLASILIAPIVISGVNKSKNNNDTVSPQNIINDHATYIIDRPFEENINTFEASIKVSDKLVKDEPIGVIFGNFYNNYYGYNGATNYLIDKDGHFRVFYNRLSGVKAEFDYTFLGYDFRSGNEEHIALTRNSNSFSFYVNGALVETVLATTNNAINDMRYQVGSDWTNWGSNIDGQFIRMPFNGEIKQISLFSNERNASEIANDVSLTHFDSDTNGLLGSWYFSNWVNLEIEDDSINKNNAKLGNYEYYYDLEEESEFDYSIICMPDIQISTRYNPAKLDYDFDWIVNNKDSKNIQYISFVGDLTDNCDIDNPLALNQWKAVQRNFEKLDSNNISYGFVPGNHDYDDGKGNNRSAAVMNRMLPYSKYSSTSYFGGGYCEGDILNYYNIKRISGVDYLFLNLEFGPRDGVILWANRIIEAHPNHRVVISTHSYIEPDGTICQASAKYAPSAYGIGSGNSSNDGYQMFDKLIKLHSNVFIVFSGHNSSDDIIYRTDKGVNGNTIHEFLIDAQGSFFSQACDVLSLFKINEARKEAYVYWYSPFEDGYLNRQNQFTISFADSSNPTIGLAKASKISSYNNSMKLIIPIAILIVAILPLPVMLIANKKGGKKHEE